MATVTTEQPDPTVRAEDARLAAVTLRGILAAVDAGEVEASTAERAHLAGAADALDQVAGDGSTHPLTENDLLP